MEARKEDILREFAGTTYMEHELVKLDLMKPRPYGTFHAVSKPSVSLYIIIRERSLKGTIIYRNLLAFWSS